MRGARLRRYELAVQLAHEVLAENPAHDSWMLAQVFDDIRDEVRAGRRNQREFPRLAAGVLRQVFADNDRWSRAAEPPKLTLLEGGESA